MLKHTHTVWSSEAKGTNDRVKPKVSVGATRPSEDCEVVAGLGLLPEGHLLVLARHHATQKPLGLLADALPAPAVGHAPRVLLLAVPPQADLPDDALEEVLHVVVERRRRLDELAVEHHGAGAALCKHGRKGERFEFLGTKLRRWSVATRGGGGGVKVLV